MKPRNMCNKCWAVWKDIITSALGGFGQFVGKVSEEDLEFLHCHHKKGDKK